MANIYESEVKDATIVEEIVNPLDEAVNEKVYTNSNVNVSFEELNKPIEEPRFTPPPIKKQTIQSNEPNAKKEPINPEMKSLPKKEVDNAASQAATLIFSSYDFLHQLANKNLQVSEKKLNQLQSEGDINLNAMIDYDYGKKIRAGDFFQEYNEHVKDFLKVSDEFKEETRPVLERVLAKKGIGMTDEQLLIFLFSKDIASKAFLFFQQKAVVNNMIESIREATLLQQQNSYQAYAQQQQASYQPYPKQQQQQERAKQNTSATTKNTEYVQKDLFEDEDDNEFMPEEPEEKKSYSEKNEE